MRSMNISLTDEDFKKLVNGEIVEKELLSNLTIRILLKDIGFLRMYDHINEAAGYSINKHAKEKET